MKVISGFKPVFRTIAGGRFVALMAILFIFSAAALAQAPVLFFSDLTSGPNSGGENNNGAYVTVYGNFLGSSQGNSTITVGGGQLVNCKQWGTLWAVFPSGQNWLQKITCQLGASAATGNIVVTVGGQPSNGLPFTVRPGSIYFVSGTGSDSNKGSFSAPWRTLPHAVQTMSAEGIVYAMNGSDSTSADGTAMNAALGFRTKWCGPGPNGYPRAAVVYPGNSVTIGSANNNPAFGIRTSDWVPDVCVGYWTFAGFNVRGNGAIALGGPGSNWRVVGNDISCPAGNGEDACLHTALYWNNFDNLAGGSGCTHPCNSPANNLGAQVLGNNIHDVGVVGPMSEYHALYFSTDTRHSEAGWNLIYNVNGCRGIETNSSPDSGAPGSGQNMFDLHFHDNVIHDTQCDGIDINDVDPSQGPIEAYNNIIYKTGKGNVTGGGSWNCIQVTGGHESVAANPSGTVMIYNNTFYNCGGSFTNPPYEGNSGLHNSGHGANVKGNLENNIVYQVSNGNSADPSEYWFDELKGSGITGNTNVMFGIGAAPATSQPSVLPGLTGTTSADPSFANLGGFDFHLNSGSVAIASGAPVAGLARDIEGKLRPANNPAIGALEFSSSTSSNPGPQLSTLSCAPASFVGPGSANCTVTLTAPASASGIAVTLSSSVGQITVPGSITVPSGSSTAQFSATGVSVAASTTAVITAQSGGGSTTFSLTITPTVTASAVVCSPSTMTGAGALNCTVNLSGAAPGSGAVVSISDNNAVLTVPASVTVYNRVLSASEIQALGTGQSIP